MALGACAATPRPAGCDWLGTTADAGGPQLAIVTDTTGSRVTTAWPRDVVDAVAAVAHQGGTVSLVGVDGGGVRPAVVWARQPVMTPDAAATPREDGVADSAAACAAAVASSVPTRAGTDLVGAVNAAVETLGPRRAGDRLIVLSDGYSSAGALRFDEGIDIGDSPPDAVADAIVTSGALADLAGRDVTVELGDTQGPPAGQPVLRWLEAVYLALCHRGGATRCDVVRDVAPGAPVRAGLPPDPVTWPAERPAMVGPSTGPGIVQIDTTALFEPGSADLRPGTDELLRPLAMRLRPGSGARAEIVGHVASWGSQSYRQNLSELRDRAIAATLAALGANPAAMSARGVGSTQQVADDIGTDGRLRPVPAAANRRVEIRIEEPP